MIFYGWLYYTNGCRKSCKLYCELSGKQKIYVSWVKEACKNTEKCGLQEEQTRETEKR